MPNREWVGWQVFHAMRQQARELAKARREA